MILVLSRLPGIEEAEVTLYHIQNAEYQLSKVAFNKKKTLFTSKLDLNLRRKLLKCYILIITLFGAETWTLQKVEQKHLESFGICCWRRMEKISWTDHVKNMYYIESRKRGLSYIQ